MFFRKKKHFFTIYYILERRIVNSLTTVRASNYKTIYYSVQKYLVEQVIYE